MKSTTSEASFFRDSFLRLLLSWKGINFRWTIDRCKPGGYAIFTASQPGRSVRGRTRCPTELAPAGPPASVVRIERDGKYMATAKRKHPGARLGWYRWP